MLWEFHNPSKRLIEEFTIECGITELQAKLLINRGINTLEEANLYLYGDLRDLYDPSLLCDIEKATDILVKAKNEDLKIFIAGDYDVDGITSCVETAKAFEHIGIRCEYYIPHRIKEGYGLSMKAIDDAIQRGCDIIYTVDNGISAKTQVKKAKDLGLYVIVTDHHDVPMISKHEDSEEMIEDLPPADAIINPKRKDCKYPNKKLCGCTISWKVLFHLYRKLGISVQYLYDLMTFTALSTVGDMMDLDGENRIFVKEGLKRINRDMNLGIKKLKKIYNLDEVTSGDIGFRLVPTLNADGRLEDAYKAAELLYENKIPELKLILDKIGLLIGENSNIEELEYLRKDIELEECSESNLKEDLSRFVPNFNVQLPLEDIFKILKEEIIKRNEHLNELANTLYETNQKRKELTIQFVEETIEIINKNKLDEYNIIIVFHKAIPEGLVGLVAGRIKEKYQKPTFIFTDAEEHYKGSGRGVEGHPFSLSYGLQLTKDLWVKGGGHPMAAGLSFEKDIHKLNEFRERLSLYIDILLEKTNFVPKVKLDALINVPTEENCREIEIIEPSGKGNPPVAFGTDLMRLKEAKPVGDDGVHIRFKSENDLVGIAFNKTDLYNELGHPEELRFIYAPNINVYKYTNYKNEEITLRSIQMMIQGFDSETPKIVPNKNLLISTIRNNISKRK